MKRNKFKKGQLVLLEGFNYFHLVRDMEIIRTTKEEYRAYQLEKPSGFICWEREDKMKPWPVKNAVQGGGR